MEPFVEGWTAPIDYQLKKDGVPFNATGMSIALEMRDKNGIVVAEIGPTVWLDPAVSSARFTPNATDLTFARSPIRVHWKVTAGAATVFFPRGEAEEWVIYQP